MNKNINTIFLNVFYYCAGLLFLLLAKIRHSVFGYSPRNFSSKKVLQSFEHAEKTMLNFSEFLNKHKINLSGKKIIEIGPGADAYFALLTLKNGAKKYQAFDLYKLWNINSSLYDKFFTYLLNKGVDVSNIKKEFSDFKNSLSNSIVYKQDRDFDIKNNFNKGDFNFIFSQAAFEHLDSPRKFISDISDLSNTFSLDTG